MKEALEVLDNVRLNFSPSGLIALNITIAFIMFGVALDIKTQQFKDLMMHPKSVLVGVLSQFILLPAVTFLFIILLTIIVSSCAPGNEKFDLAPAGFFMGLWHGFIAFFSFIISLFTDLVNIYEINNNGSWYNFGFIIGISAFFGGGGKTCCR